MTHNFFRRLILSASLFCAVFIAPAAADDCTLEPEMIFEFSAPKIGSYTVWDATHGDVKFEERYKTGLLSGGIYVMAAGERYGFEGGPVSLILHKLEKRGRIEWQKEHQIEGLRSVHKILPHPQGFLVAGDASQPQKSKGAKPVTDLWLGVFSADGELVKQSRISSKDEHLEMQEMIALPAANKLLVSSYVRPVSGANGFSRLYLMDMNGKILTQRSYTPGVENKVIGLAETAPGTYAAAGYIWSGDGRRAGWVMSLSQNLSINWEQQYPRGRGAKFSHVMGYISNAMIVAGDTVPYGDGNRAGWVMAVDMNTGAPLWQRYYSGDMHYDAIEGLVSTEGLISILLAAQKPLPVSGKEEDAEKEDYVRLLTINPRGILLNSDEYFNAKGAQASQMFYGPEQQRILIGGSRVEYDIAGPAGEPPKKVPSTDAWVVSAIAMGAYKDPCIKPMPFMP